jgi:hypothetical protein
VTLSNWNITSISTSVKHAINIKHSSVSLIKNVTVSQIEHLSIIVHNSMIESVVDLKIIDSLQAIHVFDQSSLSLSNSTFENLGSTSLLEGAALSVQNSNVFADNSTFKNNTTINAGSIDLRCDKTQKCSYSIKNCVFNQSMASKSGGAIRYNLYRPEFNNNQFTNNTALYGQNIASYPIRMRMGNATANNLMISDVPSGIKYQNILNFSLVDHDDQVMVLDDVSLIEVKGGSNFSTSETTAVKVTKGISTFDNLVFIANPGMKNVLFQIQSDALDLHALQLQYSEPFDNKLDVSFRY